MFSRLLQRVGGFLAFAGFVSAILHFTSVQLKILMWAEPMQPLLGLALGGVGALLFWAGSTMDKNKTPAPQHAVYPPPPGGYPQQGQQQGPAVYPPAPQWTPAPQQMPAGQMPPAQMPQPQMPQPQMPPANYPPPPQNYPPAQQQPYGQPQQYQPQPGQFGPQGYGPNR